jgi:chromosome segregation ATPase
MTKTQLERLAVVENEIKTVKEAVADVRSTVQEVKEDQIRNHTHLAGLINELKESVSTKLNSHEDRLKAVEDTIEPLTKFKRKLWTMVVTTALTCAFVAIIYVEVKRYKP